MSLFGLESDSIFNAEHVRATKSGQVFLVQPRQLDPGFALIFLPIVVARVAWQYVKPQRVKNVLCLPD